jgi:hypothetical protein
MAAWASCLIWPSSRSRAVEASFLVVGIASPTATVLIVVLAAGSTHGHKIMGDDAPANVSFKSNLALVKGSLHVEAVFERAQPRFNAGSPAPRYPLRLHTRSITHYPKRDQKPMVDNGFDSLAGIDLEPSDRDIRVVAEKPIDRGSVIATISQGDLNFLNGFGGRHVIHYLRVQR